MQHFAAPFGLIKALLELIGQRLAAVLTRQCPSTAHRQCIEVIAAFGQRQHRVGSVILVEKVVAKAPGGIAIPGLQAHGKPP